MSKPRQILPGQFYLINRRCTQRLFLLRPDDATNNAFIYCLAVAARRCEIDVLLPVAESNHHHTVIFDRNGRVPKFVENFHKLLARSQNALRGRWENFWAAEDPCIVRLVDPTDVIAKLVYAATNPVKDHLVERIHHWPGVNGYTRLMTGRPLHATRPRHFFRDPGPMPESVTLTLKIPPELGDKLAVLADLRERVEAVERDVAMARRQTGAGIVGRRRVLEQSWRDAPASVEPRRNLRPRFAARDPVARVAAPRLSPIRCGYRDARTQWLQGIRAPFPPGTYALRRLIAIPITTA
jgi:hypothetical protein